MMARYGFFDSSFSAADAVAGSVELGQLEANSAGLFWVEFRPDEGGRNALCFLPWARTDSSDCICLTPEGFNIRSCVYEYGGKSWCWLSAEQGIAFVNNQDQQIWRQQLPSSSNSDGQPQQLTQQQDCRYGDPVYDALRQRLIAVQERQTDDPTQPEHRLVAIDIHSGEITSLVSGDDFYASPTLDQTGQQLAWISWQHPHMPWVSTQLKLATLNHDGAVDSVVVVAGDSDSNESIQQPRFDPNGGLIAISDQSGWWNLYRYLQPDGGQDSSGAQKDAEDKVSLHEAADPIWPMAAEFGIAQWQLGVSTWDFLSKGPQGEGSQDDTAQWLVASYHDQGQGYLAMRHMQNDTQLTLANEFNLFRHISCFDGRIYCVAASTGRTPAVLEIKPDLQDGASGATIKVITGHEQVDGLERISCPHCISYPVSSNEIAHGFLYLPKPMGMEAKPPLVVFSHGGPTASSYPVFNPKIQFWTERGFAVVDLNYRGSTGYGRDYRHRLAKSWGLTDVEDAIAAVSYLSDSNMIDGDSVFIRGGSAGGYTTLATLVASDQFRGGASYYGVSDPLTLARDTHKFESRYLDWLLGDPVLDIQRYRERSPLLAADRIQCPMIFFQGGEDKVVVPDQTEQMVNALQKNGVRVEYKLYPDEQHGFRKSENQIDSLEAELQFYQSLLKN